MGKPSSQPVHVAAAAIMDRHGRLLLALRSAQSHQGGLWEFPGGKIEPGELVEMALARELQEELGITPLQMRPLICVPYSYPDLTVILDVWRVERFEGEVHGREGQVIEWVELERLDDYDFPAANLPIIKALQLPSRYLITPEPQSDLQSYLDTLERALKRGISLVQLRAKSLDEANYLRLAEQVLTLCRSHGARLLLNSAAERVIEIGADGVHLTSAKLMSLASRPLPAGYLVAASCHSGEQLQQAVMVGADFAQLSPVAVTATHPEATPIGWEQFEKMVRGLPLPVYALGGLGEKDLDVAYQHGAQGVAAIRAFWSE